MEAGGGGVTLRGQGCSELGDAARFPISHVAGELCRNENTAGARGICCWRRDGSSTRASPVSSWGTCC